jgi:hypothetical protein
MKDIISATTIILPAVGLFDFPPPKQCRVAFKQTRLDLDTRSGLHLDFFDLPVINERWRVGVTAQPLEIKERIYANVNFTDHPSAEPRISWRYLFSEDQRTDVNRPPVIRCVDHLTRSFVERTPGAYQRAHRRAFAPDFLQLGRTIEFEGEGGTVATSEVIIVPVLDDPGCKPYCEMIGHRTIQASEKKNVPT